MKTQQSASEKTISQQRIKELIAEYFNGSQQDFADRCDIPKASVSQYVHGRNAPGNIKAAKIGEALNINPLWVMGFNVPKEINQKSERVTSNQEQQLIALYRTLNADGKAALLSHAQLLSESKTYTADTELSEDTKIS